MSSELTGYMDVAQVALYAFWIFFAGLVFYLRREDKREGYPLESERSGSIRVQGFPASPGNKTYQLRGGHTATLPNWKSDRRDAPVAAVASWPGAPNVPTGVNPMLDGVGPGSYADREDIPELTMENIPAIVPLRVEKTVFIEPRDPDPRGMEVWGVDNAVGGVVSDVWVDRAEALIRYLEVAVPGGRNVLLPMTMAVVDKSRRRVMVHAILGSQFADVPALANPDQVTKREEDKIVGYYGAGYLYATPSRQEPLL